MHCLRLRLWAPQGTHTEAESVVSAREAGGLYRTSTSLLGRRAPKAGPIRKGRPCTGRPTPSAIVRGMGPQHDLC